MRTQLAAIISALAFMVWAAPACADRINVYAAASLKDALDDIIKQYQAESGNTAVGVYAASSTLAKQIENGAPADIFISADLDWMNYLETRKLL
ncbi:MAG TPA: molybdate ABC transporter substrate-binding protein, partial [Burkholderiales bacterium]|nr:molybdate ABC transporter substrate-binding protein [Burkholderiales bacterium]